VTTPARSNDTLDNVNTAAVTGSANSDRDAARVAPRQHVDPFDGAAVAPASQHSRWRQAQVRRRLRSAEQPSLIWQIRWYRARWAAHRTIRSRRLAV
jgi:hypothetical protein